MEDREGRGEGEEEEVEAEAEEEEEVVDLLTHWILQAKCIWHEKETLTNAPRSTKCDCSNRKKRKGKGDCKCKSLNTNSSSNNDNSINSISRLPLRVQSQSGRCGKSMKPS